MPGLAVLRGVKGIMKWAVAAASGSRVRCNLALVAMFLAYAHPSAASPPGAAEIRLVLQITVDGLRADLLERYRGGLGEGGFNRLLETGTIYTSAALCSNCT